MSSETSFSGLHTLIARAAKCSVRDGSVGPPCRDHLRTRTLRGRLLGTGPGGAAQDNPGREHRDRLSSLLRRAMQGRCMLLLHACGVRMYRCDRIISKAPRSGCVSCTRSSRIVADLTVGVGTGIGLGIDRGLTSIPRSVGRPSFRMPISIATLIPIPTSSFL
jgi:hypothetical protein